MQIAGLVTDEGLFKCIEALSKGGWKIYPYQFAISNQLGEMKETRTYDTINDIWYAGNISGRVFVNVHTIEFLCTIPPNSTTEPQYIREIYLLSKDEEGKIFLLSIGQIQTASNTGFLYNPDGSTTLRVRINIQNLNMTDLFMFKYTQAQEVFEHNYDPKAHPNIAVYIENSVENHDKNPKSHQYLLDILKNIADLLSKVKEQTSSVSGVTIPRETLPFGEELHTIVVNESGISSKTMTVVNRNANGVVVREFDTDTVDIVDEIHQQISDAYDSTTNLEIEGGQSQSKYTYVWETSSWIEDAEGNQTRLVFCRRSDGMVVDEKYCSLFGEEKEKPIASITVEVSDGHTYTWKVGPWFNNGDGTSHRDVTCVREDGKAVDDSYCKAEKPETERGEKWTFTWEVGDWEVAEDGRFERNVYCLSSDGTPVSEKYCNIEEKPETHQGEPYTYEWFAGEWKDTNKGYQERLVYCKRSDGEVVNDSYCLEVNDFGYSNKPNSTKPYTW